MIDHRGSAWNNVTLIVDEKGIPWHILETGGIINESWEFEDIDVKNIFQNILLS